MVASSRDDRSVDALVKSKAVLDVLAELGPSTAKTISERTGEPVSSTYRLLDNLAAVGWAERGINRGEYRLGIDCVRIGGQIESRLDIQQIARPLPVSHLPDRPAQVPRSGKGHSGRLPLESLRRD